MAVSMLWLRFGLPWWFMAPVLLPAIIRPINQTRQWPPPVARLARRVVGFSHPRIRGYAKLAYCIIATCHIAIVHLAENTN